MARDWAKQAGAAFAPGAEAALLVRCGEDQFLLKNEIESWRLCPATARSHSRWLASWAL